MKKHIGIVGSGIAGLSCAWDLVMNDLRSCEVEVSLFEKCFEVGGRMKSLDVGNGYIFDHGAQYFTARSEEFSSFVSNQPYIKEWKCGEDGIKSLEMDEESQKLTIKSLSSRTKRYTGETCVGSVCKNMEKKLSENICYRTHLNTNISRIELNDEEKWRLFYEEDKKEVENCFDILLLSGTPNEIRNLINKSLKNKPDWFPKISHVKMKPVGGLMLTFRERQKQVPFDAAFVNHTDKVTWICRENTKPGKKENKSKENILNEEQDNWLIHFSPKFSDEVWGEGINKEVWSDLDLFEKVIQKEVLDPFGVQFEVVDSGDDILFLRSFVWMESDCQESLDVGFLYDEKMKIGLIVDWINNDRVEGGFLSGYLGSKHLKETILK